MGLNVGGLYVRTRGAITVEQVRDAVVRYWTGRGATPSERPPSAHESLGIESTGRLALGVFPDVDGWIGIYDSERYTCDPNLIEFLADSLETEVVGFVIAEVSDAAYMIQHGPASDDAVQTPEPTADYWETIELVEQTFPYPFVYFDQLDDDDESIQFVAFENIGPDEEKQYAGPSPEELTVLAAQEARVAALAEGDVSVVEGLLDTDPSSASALIAEVVMELSPEAAEKLVELALSNPSLRLPPDLWLDAYEDTVWEDDERAKAIAAAFEALELPEHQRQHLFWHRRNSFDSLIRSGDHEGQIPHWETTILAYPGDAQSLYSLVMSLRIVRDTTDDKAKYTERIEELGKVLEALEPANWLDASYRAYALNDCFACELCDHGTTHEAWERGLRFSNASLGPFAWNLYHQGTKAEILGKLGRTEESFELLRFIETMHPKLMPDSPPMAAMFTDEYRQWAKSATGPVIAPADTDVPGSSEPSEAFRRDPAGLDTSVVQALWGVRPGDTEWERARRAALVGFVLDPVVRREMEGDVAEWLAQLQFMQVDLREGEFASSTLAPETTARMRHWYILSTINPFMSQPGNVYLFGEWRRDAPSKAWVEATIADALEAAGQSADHIDTILKRAESATAATPAIVPFGGADHPMVSDAVDVWVEMKSAGSGWIDAVRSQLEPGWKALETWIKKARASGADITSSAGGACVTVRADNLRSLLHELESAIDPEHLIELAFVPSELRDPRAPTFIPLPEDDDDALWRASFDQTPLAPLPEEADPCDYYDPDEMREIRLPIYDPDVKVICGIVTEVDDLEWEPRATEVARAVIAALDTRFNGAAPQIWNKASEGNGPVDRIEREGRRGYGFAVQMNDDAMFRTYPGAVRFREYELVMALCDAVKALHLEPVVHWTRYDPYIINLWERM